MEEEKKKGEEEERKRKRGEEISPLPFSSSSSAAQQSLIPFSYSGDQDLITELRRLQLEGKEGHGEFLVFLPYEIFDFILNFLKSNIRDIAMFRKSSKMLYERIGFVYPSIPYTVFTRYFFEMLDDPIIYLSTFHNYTLILRRRYSTEKGVYGMRMFAYDNTMPLQTTAALPINEVTFFSGSIPELSIIDIIQKHEKRRVYGKPIELHNGFMLMICKLQFEQLICVFKKIIISSLNPRLRFIAKSFIHTSSSIDLTVKRHSFDFPLYTLLANDTCYVYRINNRGIITSFLNFSTSEEKTETTIIKQTPIDYAVLISTLGIYLVILTNKKTFEWDKTTDKIKNEDIFTESKVLKVYNYDKTSINIVTTISILNEVNALFTSGVDKVFLFSGTLVNHLFGYYSLNSNEVFIYQMLNPNLFTLTFNAFDDIQIYSKTIIVFNAFDIIKNINRLIFLNVTQNTFASYPVDIQNNIRGMILVDPSTSTGPTFNVLVEMTSNPYIGNEYALKQIVLIYPRTLTLLPEQKSSLMFVNIEDISSGESLIIKPLEQDIVGNIGLISSSSSTSSIVSSSSSSQRPSEMEDIFGNIGRSSSSSPKYANSHFSSKKKQKGYIMKETALGSFHIDEQKKENEKQSAVGSFL